MFKHRPLATGRDQIRLIRFLSYSKTLELEVSSFDLNHHLPDFHALSYMWGPEQPSHSIQLNGQRFVIRDNLYTFFQTLVPTYFGTEVFLWIDQICIDQTSIPERNAQVAMMAEIYGRAGHVILWLNPGQSNSGPLALDEVMNCVQSMYKITDIPARYVERKSPGLSCYSHTSSSWLRHIRSLSRKDKEVVATTILSNLYWTRVWIVQEVLLARNIDIFFGHYHLSWESIQALCDLYSVPGLAAASAMALRTILHEKRKSRISLSNLLWDFRNNECENPRDKVFGFLGILQLWQVSVPADVVSPRNSTLSSGIIVDYAKPVHAVLLEAVPIITTETINTYPPQTPRQRVSAIIRATENAFYLCRAMIPNLFALDDFITSIRVTYVSNLEKLLQLHHNVSLAMLEGKEGQWVVGQIKEVIEDPLSFGKRVRLLESDKPEVHKEIIKAEFARLQLLLAQPIS